MQKLTISIETQNAAFGDSDNDKAYELARILRGLAESLEFWGTNLVDGSIRDSNGNTCGKIRGTK